jgi:4-diphosphocytidyl-2-C-methyl-D-erythritol kinase
MELKAHAKINLALSVTARRDDGFHELDTLFARLALHDVIQLEQRPQGVTCTITADPDLELGQALPNDERNLAVRAAQAYFAAANITAGLHIRLDKHIPVAAGLGGGSSDAAAVLRGLQVLFPSEVGILKLARELGSDVAFFVHDLPAARGQGRGEILTPLQLAPQQLVLVNPRIAVSAGEAYQALETFTPELRLPIDQQQASLNALQAGVIKRYPDIAELLMTLSTQGLTNVLMSGSGSSCFGIAQDAAEAKRIAALLKAAYPGYFVRATYTC